MNMIIWLQNWYQSQCDGDWEHQYGISITTIDNPGWYLSIDLIYTPYQDIEIELKNYEKDEHDWFSYKVKEGKFEAFGDPSKLEVLINTFKTFWETEIK